MVSFFLDLEFIIVSLGRLFMVEAGGKLTPEQTWNGSRELLISYVGEFSTIILFEGEVSNFFSVGKFSYFLYASSATCFL